MWPFKRQTSPQELYVTAKDLDLLTAHGLPSGSRSYITMLSGAKDKTIIVGDIGMVVPVGGVVSCPECGDPASWAKGTSIPSWAKGDSITEMHWNIDENNPSNSVGFSLTCFEFAFRLHLNTAAMSYEGGGGLEDVLREGRLALVRVEISDLLSVQSDPISSWRAQEQGIPLEDVRQTAPVDIKTRKLKVLDVVDQLRLVPERSLVNTIFDRFEQSEEWRREWHRLIDAMQPGTWREFLANFASATQRLGIV